MPGYGKAEYWDDRYAADESPFDWLFGFEDVKYIINALLPSKETTILLVGSGNAPFSPDMCFRGGYCNLINIDISKVVVEQQRLKYPQINWEVMDVLDMSYEDGSVPAVVDKSLIDTLLCYKNSAIYTKRMLDEIHRVMAPGARYITFSLHSVEEVIGYFTSASAGGDYTWAVSTFHVKSTRWNEGENRRRAVAHTMIVCDKPDDNGVFRGSENDGYLLLPTVESILSDEEYHCLVEYAAKVNEREALKKLDVSDLVGYLDRALGKTSNIPSPASLSKIILKSKEGDEDEDEHSWETKDASPSSTDRTSSKGRGAIEDSSSSSTIVDSPRGIDGGIL